MKKLMLLTAFLVLPVLSFPKSLEKLSVDGTATVNPNIQNRTHRAGNVWLTIHNWGYFGNDGPSSGGAFTDPEYPGTWAPQCEFPAGSGTQYLFTGSLWIGAIIEDEGFEFPRVSTGNEGWTAPTIHELFPGEGSEHGIIEGSNVPDSWNRLGQYIFDPAAVSTQDFTAEYTDTLTDPIWVRNDPIDGPHLPLDVKVLQSSRAFDAPGYEDFIIFDYIIENIGDQYLTNLYIGLYIDADVGRIDEVPHWHQDDLCGFLESYEIEPGQTWEADLAYICDNDGRPYSVSSGNEFTSPGVAGVRILKSPDDTKEASFNWWISNGNSELDFGPSWEDDNSGGWTETYGTPVGDERKYFLMSNGERDYDQVYADDPGWISNNPQGTNQWKLPDIQYAIDLANGYDTRYLISWGPLGIYDHTTPTGTDIYLIAPGESVEFSFAYICGDNFHDENNPQPTNVTIDPSLFDFEDFVNNAYQVQQLFDTGYSIIPPYRPVNLSQIMTPFNDVELSWDAHAAEDFQEYELFRRLSEGEYSTNPLHSSTLDTNYYLDDSVQPGEDYYYKIRALSSEGLYSAFSDEINIIAGAPSTPENLRLTAGNQEIEIRWDPNNQQDLAGYRLYLSEYEVEYSGAYNEPEIIWLDDVLIYEGVDNNYTDSGLTNGLVYYYRVLAYDWDGIEAIVSDRIEGVPFALDQGILLLDLTSIAFIPIFEIPDNAVIDTFYMDLLNDLGEDFTYWDNSGFDPDQLPTLEDLSNYEIVICYLDDHGMQPPTPMFLNPFNALISQYLDLGGNLFIGGRSLFHKLAGSNGWYYGYNDLIYNYLGIESIYIQRYSASSETDLFIGCDPLVSEYPEIMVDYDRTSEILWPFEDVEPGELPEIDRLDPVEGNPKVAPVYNYISNLPEELRESTGENAYLLSAYYYPPRPEPDSTSCYLMVEYNNVQEVSYIFNYTKDQEAVADSITDDYLYVVYDEGPPWEPTDYIEVDYTYLYTSIQDGHPCGIRYLSDEFRTITFSFPLYFMEPDVSFTVMERILEDFRKEIDTSPPILTLGVVQDPVLTQMLDIYLTSNEALSSATISVDGDDFIAEQTSSGSSVYHIDYTLTGSDTIALAGLASDAAGNQNVIYRTFVSHYINALSGGSIASFEGGFSAFIPPNCLDNNTYVLVSQDECTSPCSFKTFGKVYSISPGNAKLNGQMSLTFSYDSAELDNMSPEGLAIYRLENGEWMKLKSRVDESNGKVTAAHNEFGEYILGWSEINLLPDKFNLSQNFPNPFNPSTTVAIDLPERREISIQVFNVLGQRVATLASGYLDAGTHNFHWDGSSDNNLQVGSGLYFCKAKAGNEDSTIKMILMK